MSKAIKVVLAIFGTLIALIVAAAIIIPMVVDPNDFRGQISKAVKEQTGRDLALGDISLSVFPWLRVRISDVSLSNAQGFGDTPMAAAREAAVGVELFPLLFDKQFKISTLKLDGLRLDLAKDAAGKSNWDDLVPAEGEEKAPEAPQAEGEGLDLNSIDFAGIDIRDSAVSYRDAQAGQDVLLQDFALETGAFKPGKPLDVKTSLTAVSQAQKLDADLTLSATVTPDMDAQIISVENLKLQLQSKLDEISAQLDLAAKVEAALQDQRFSVSGLDLKAMAEGASIPGGKQAVNLTGALVFDQAQGTMHFSNAHIQAAGLNIRTDIKGQGINGDSPKLSGPIQIEPFNLRELLAKLDQKLETTDPGALKTASLSANYSGSFSSARLDQVALTLDQTQASGYIGVRDFASQALEFALKVNEIDADRYMPPGTAKPAAKPKPDGTKKSGDSDINSTEIPVKALESINASGTLDVAKLKLKGATMKDVRVKIDGPKGAPKQVSLDLNAYGGKLATSTKIGAGAKPSYALNTRIQTVTLGPVLQQFVGKDFVTGLGDINVNLTSAGNTVGDVRQALNGDLSLSFKNGAIKGFNLGEILRRGEALFKGQQYQASPEPPETDFAQINFAARVVNGILKSNQLDARSPLFRVVGNGEIDLFKETLNYLAQPTVVGTAEGQGGKALEELAGLTIPIQLTGSLTAPKYKLDLKTALQQKAGDELRGRVADKVLGGESGQAVSETELKQKAKEKLNKEIGRGLQKLFGAKTPKAPPAEAEPPEETGNTGSSE